MENFDVYKDITERTGGDIYVGVVGPVRAGKSTFITSFVNKLIMPKVKGKHAKERMQDELPQSADGKTIMTTQPKFVPNEAVAISLGDNIDIRVRLVDCVGYLIDGATGHMDGEKPRMVKTPWSDKEMSFLDAADYGTKKVIAEHSSIGVVMTTDGSIATDIPRGCYIEAEERVVSELTALGKPFVVVLNSTVPTSPETIKLADSLKEKYNTAVLPMDVSKLTEQDITTIFEKLLYEFPLRKININADKWLQALPQDNSVIADATSKIVLSTSTMTKMSDYTKVLQAFDDSQDFTDIKTETIDLSKGIISYNLTAKRELFYSALSDECGMAIADDFDLISNLKEYAKAKKEYDKLKLALEQVKECGYGVVNPSLDDMLLAEPQIVRQGGRFGVKLKATAPALHIMQVDMVAEVSPVMGTEQQSEEIVSYLMQEFAGDGKSIWQTNMFGKSLQDIINENISQKTTAMPPETQKKMRRTLSRIVNEGKGGVICILL